MRTAAPLLLVLCAALPARADSNPMQPGTWEFTRSGGMAANLIGRFCITASDIADPLSPVNGFLSREEKSTCPDWKMEWHGGRGEYSGSCRLGGKPARVSGRIVAAAATYSDTQNVQKEGDTAVSPILDIINGLRLGACAN
ncbi:MAG: DUF3617 family protein [Betaproteobacteria bacterium]|jgi:hypothetical protein